MQQLVADGVLVAYVNLMTTPTREKLAEKPAGAIYEHVASALDLAREAALAPFRGLRVNPRVTVDPGTARTRSRSASTTSPPTSMPPSSDASSCRPSLRPARTGVSPSVFDEFQEIETIDPGLPKLMRTIFEQQPEVGHVYSGSRRHMMERIFNDENEPFWRSAKKVQLDDRPGGLPAVHRQSFREQEGDRAGGSSTGSSIGPSDIPMQLRSSATSRGSRPWSDDEAGREELEQALAGVLRSSTHTSNSAGPRPAAQKLLLHALAAEPGRPLPRLPRAPRTSPL